MRIATQIMLLLGTLLAAPSAGADEPLNLVWNAPQGCPSGETVRAEAQRILGGTTTHHVTARADVTQIDPADWSVHLTTNVDGARGERTLNANSCASLASATALIVALTVDPTKARAALRSSQHAGWLQHATPKPARARLARSPSATQPFGLVAASAAFELGSLPSAAFGGELAVGTLLGPVRLELTGADWVAQDATQTVHGSSEGARIHLIDVTLAGCFRGRIGRRFEADPCLGGAVIFASSDGHGPAPEFSARHESSSWGGVRAELVAAWSLVGPFALRASVGAGVPFVRRRFVIILKPPQSDVVLHRPSAATVRASVGLEARFP